MPHQAANRATRRHPDAEPVPLLYVSLYEAGARVGLHDRTIRRAIQAGEIRGFKFGKALRVRLDELDAWAESKAMPDPYGGRRLVAVKGR